MLFRPWSLLCNQLQYVVGEVMRFATIDVLEPLWGDMEAQLARAANMDDVGGQTAVGDGPAGAADLMMHTGERHGRHCSEIVCFGTMHGKSCFLASCTLGTKADQ